MWRSSSSSAGARHEQKHQDSLDPVPISTNPEALTVVDKVDPGQTLPEEIIDDLRRLLSSPSRPETPTSIGADHPWPHNLDNDHGSMLDQDGSECSQNSLSESAFLFVSSSRQSSDNGGQPTGCANIGVVTDQCTPIPRTFDRNDCQGRPSSDPLNYSSVSGSPNYRYGDQMSTATTVMQQSARTCDSQLQHTVGRTRRARAHQQSPIATNTDALAAPIPSTSNLVPASAEASTIESQRDFIPPPVDYASRRAGKDISRLGDVDTESTRDEPTVSSGPGLLSHHKDKWMTHYRELVRYYHTHGNCLVHPKHASSQLCHWVKRQRFQYKQKRSGKHSVLTDERQRMLEELGFCWDSHEAVWETHFQELVRYKQQHGHTNVPMEYPDNPQLGVFVKGQRKQYRRDMDRDPSRIRASHQSRYERLEALGFQWTLRPNRQRGGKQRGVEGTRSMG